MEANDTCGVLKGAGGKGRKPKNMLILGKRDKMQATRDKIRDERKEIRYKSIDSVTALRLPVCSRGRRQSVSQIRMQFSNSAYHVPVC